MENNNENKQNVNVNEQQAQVENNEKKSWFGTAISAVKNTAGAAAGFVEEHKTMTAVGAGVITVGTIALVVLKKKGKVEEPAVDADGFDNK
jgi:hypothetical protein